jgi:[histone H3]-lysine36 N-dimethyltransferase SETMAR
LLPYSPDGAPSDFHDFRSLEHFLRGKVFENENQIRRALDEYFETKNQEFDRIEKLPGIWEKMIESGGK